MRASRFVRISLAAGVLLAAQAACRSAATPAPASQPPQAEAKPAPKREDASAPAPAPAPEAPRPAPAAPPKPELTGMQAVLASIPAGWIQIIWRQGAYVIEADCVGPKALTFLDPAGAAPRLRVNFGLQAITLPVRGATRVDDRVVDVDVEWYGTRSIRMELIDAEVGVVAMWSEKTPVPPKAQAIFKRPERFVAEETRTLYRQEAYGCPVAE
jgi:hypothetical protein